MVLKTHENISWMMDSGYDIIFSIFPNFIFACRDYL